MSYTEQQLADLYEKAVSAEAAGDHATDAGFALDNTVLELAPNYGGLIRSLIDQLRAAGRRPELPEPEPEIVRVHMTAMEAEGDLVIVPRGLLGTALAAIRHPEQPAPMSVALLKAYAYTHARPIIPEKGQDSTVNTGLRWDDYKAISDRAPVHEALTGFTEDATEDNAITLIQAIAEALRPRPRFWIDMHGFSCHLLHSEADAIAHCNDTGGLYVLPLYAGEPINCKLPMRMCRPALEPETIPVNRLIANIKSLPQRYAAPYVQLSEVLDIIEYLRKDQ